MVVPYRINEGIRISGQVDDVVFGRSIGALARALQDLGLDSIADYQSDFALDDDGANQIFVMMGSCGARGTISGALRWISLVDLCILRPLGCFFTGDPFTFWGESTRGAGDVGMARFTPEEMVLDVFLLTPEGSIPRHIAVNYKAGNKLMMRLAGTLRHEDLLSWRIGESSDPDFEAVIYKRADGTESQAEVPEAFPEGSCFRTFEKNLLAAVAAGL